MDKLSIMGVRINNISMNEVLKLAEQKIKNDEKYIIYTPNTEIIMMCQKDEEFLNIMNKSNINVPDGVGLIYAGKIKKFPLKEKVAGYDLSINLLKMADEKGLKLYAVGGRPGVAEAAMQNVQKKYPGIKIVGAHHGYFKGTHLGKFGHEEEIAVIEDINRHKPHILFVGFGAKKQEQWIEYNKDLINANIIIGNGGTLDGLAGIVKRAPDIFINLGLEWLYRLIKEPKRITRQIVLPVFMFKVIFGNKDIVKKIE
ncbi:MAG TPA: WecB/TagA/CpsF family glycosyltransferase [Sedimentibacter sp.]|jgi:N-acetylglucosaminyldiphosphoundecaprenol N-acetyl-beta-D-mannosaminyltransferase|nr:WecB/TagA/CpsF family glycosyltransferase [Tissierellia bacterium]HOG63014.1 WecB/TagA/CpsF family glycosyltransferase [Sedimentibacter sp.]HPB79912.1 WecB/TagA/CpsF family glycosyltransferase [Sedimentibacter sp.]HPY56369.1 WecB/TagA/CpsF family glycosyltransferase [Sedimentibacter sp.]HQC70520.1 WecB/TagA/CpsF family glycosyltransferase [Sedimentibacter sp.]